MLWFCISLYYNPGNWAIYTSLIGWMKAEREWLEWNISNLSHALFYIGFHWLHFLFLLFFRRKTHGASFLSTFNSVFLLTLPVLWQGGHSLMLSFWILFSVIIYSIIYAVSCPNLCNYLLFKILPLSTQPSSSNGILEGSWNTDIYFWFI